LAEELAAKVGLRAKSSALDHLANSIDIADIGVRVVALEAAVLESSDAINNKA
jgi:hypothetical protein